MPRSYQMDKLTDRNASMNLALGRRRKMAMAVSVTTAALAPVAMGSKNVDVQRVVSGSAQISTVGNRTIIRAADRTIIDFKSFNVAPDESVQFIQPTSTSRVLDRINSQTPSKIDGSISANGIIYFVNPSGVTFGPHSVVTASQIFTAGGGMTNANFLAGNNTFQVSGKVENDGSISAANGVALIGQQLVNNGTITASNGVVVFALGGEVYVGSKDENIIVKVNPAAAAASAASKSTETLENTGSITAADEADMSSSDMYATVLNIGGRVTAPKISVASGKQGTSNVTGTLDASNTKGKGGRIQVTGNAVTLTGATVNASGSTGGGDVRVGGDFHGQGTLLTSHQTLVDGASKISADSTSTGSGGTVAVWSDGNTGVHGSISAAGTTGTGGFIETSAKGVLDISKISVSAIGTKAGQWLLDPTDVDITDTVAAVGLQHEVNTAPGEDTFAPDSTTGMSYISPSTIVGVLNTGTSVKIVTGPTGNFSNLGNIKVDTDGALAVSYTTPPAVTPTLTLQADAGISILAPITVTGGKLNVTLNSLGGAQGVTIGTNLATNGGSFTATAAAGDINLQSGNSGITTGGGSVNLTASAGTVMISSPITTGGGTFTSSSGNFSLTGSTPAGSAPIDTSVAGGVGGNVSITVSGVAAGPLHMVNIDEPINSGGGSVTIAADQVGTTGNGSITTSAPLAPAGTSGGSFSVTGPMGGSTLNGVTLGAAVTTTGGAITVNAASITATGGAIDSSVSSGVPGTYSGGGVILLTGSTGAIDVKTVTAGLNNLTLQTLTTAGSITASTLEAADPVNGKSLILVSAPHSSVSAGTILSETGDTVGVSITSGGSTSATLPNLMSSLTLNIDPATSLNITSMSGLNITNSAGNLNISGTDSVTGAVTITTAAGDIDINAPLTVDGMMSLTSAQGVSVNAFVNIFPTAGAPNANLTLTSQGTGSITVGAEIDANGPLTLASSASIAINNAIKINSGVGALPQGYVTLSAGNGVTESLTTGSISGSSVGPTDALSLNGSGDFSLLGKNSISTLFASIPGTTTGTASLEFNNTSTLHTDSVVVGSPSVVGNISLTGSELDIEAPMSATGSITLTADTLTIAPITPGGGQATEVVAGTTLNILPLSTVSDVFITEVKPDEGLWIPSQTLEQLTAQSVVISTNPGGTTPFIEVGKGGGVSAPDLVSPLTLQSAGGIRLDLATGAFQTGGSQTYAGPVTVLSSSFLLAPTTGSTISFPDAVDGPGDLSVTANSTITFANAVGGMTKLNSLFAMSGKNIEIDGGSVTTAGKQTYASSVTLDSGSSTTTLTGSEIDIDAAVAAATPSQALTLAGVLTGGNFYISGQLGTTAVPLSSFTAYTAGIATTTSFSNAMVFTSGSQTYGTVSLSGSTTLTTFGPGIATVNFMSTVDSAGGSHASLDLNAAGKITFGAAVGSAGPLGSLVVEPTSEGSVYIQGGTVTTAGSSGIQSYGVAVTLANSAGNVMITGSTITFGSSLGQDLLVAPQSLVVDVSNGGTATFDGQVNLNSLNTQSTPLNTPSTVEINGGMVTTAQGQTYNNVVTLGYQPVSGPASTTMSGSFITFGETLDAETLPAVPPQALVINTDSGTTGVTFTGAVGQKSAASKLQSLTTNTQHGGSSSTTIKGGYVTTSLFQYYNEPVFLGSSIALSPNTPNTTLSGSDIKFFSTLDGLTRSEALLISATGGTVTFNGNVGESGGIYYPLNSLTIGSGGNTVISGIGITALGITTIQSQAFNNPLNLQTDTTLTAGSSVTLSTVDDVTTPGSAGLTINSVDQVFNGVIGGQHALSKLTVIGTGTTHINSAVGANRATISTTSDQAYGAAVQLSANAVLLSSGGGMITFNSTVDSDTSSNHYSLSANTTGNTTFGDSVGSINKLGSLTINDLTLVPVSAPASHTEIKGAQVHTSGSQTYNNAVVIQNTTAITSDTQGSIGFVSTINADNVAAWGFTVTAAQGNVMFGSDVGKGMALGNLTVKASGTINITGGSVMTPATINTVGDQNYEGVVSLGGNTSMTAGVLNLIKFFQALSGTFSLTTSATRTEFDGAASIGSLNVTTGNTLIIGGSVTTTGAQSYTGPVTLANATPSSFSTVLTAGGDVFFHSTLNTDAGSSTAQNLQILSQGTVTFGDAVGTIGTIRLGNLDVSASVDTAINGHNVYTTGTQTYDQNVTLGGNTVINAGKTVTFGGTLQAGVLATVASTLSITSTDQIFKNFVGDNGNKLISLDTYSVNGGAAQINGGQVTTAGYQFYHDLVTLDGSAGAGVATTTLTASSLEFTDAISAQIGASVTPQALVLDLNLSGSYIKFNGAVGDVAPGSVQQPLYSLVTQDIGGAHGNIVDINAPRITTTSFQQYGEPVTLYQSAAIKAGTSVTFSGNILDGNEVNGPADLSVSAGTVATFDGNVGLSPTAGPLKSLMVLPTEGSIVFNGSFVHTLNVQSYGNAMTMGGPNVTLNADTSSVQFLSTLSGHVGLTINSVGQTFDQPVNIISLVTTGTGAAQINGQTITTLQGQSYQDAVLLGNSVTMTAGLDVSFAMKVDDAYAPGEFGLSVNSPTNITFSQPVGMGSALQYLKTGPAGGQTNINGGVVDTTANQDYADSVFLGSPTMITAGGDVKFEQTLDSAMGFPNETLLVTSPGTITFNGFVGSGNALQNLTVAGGGTTVIGGSVSNTIQATISTVDYQSFSGPVVLTNTTNLVAGGAVTFDGAVTGQYSLTTNAGKVTTFESTASIGTLTVNGLTAIDGQFITTSLGDQYYNLAVTLGDQPSPSITLNASSNFGLANITFNSTLDTEIVNPPLTMPAQALDINATGVVTFGDNVGQKSALAQLTVEPVAGASIVIDGTLVRTIGAQSYGNPVTMKAATASLNTSGGSVSFLNTLSGNVQLTINSVGQLFDNDVRITSLTTNGTQPVVFNEPNSQTIYTTLGQTYNDAVLVNSNVTMTAGADVMFASTVDDKSLPGVYSLSVSSPGTITFQGSVGTMTAPLKNLTTGLPGGLTKINGGFVTTTGFQDYANAVTVGNNTVISAGGEVTFESTLNDGGTVPSGASISIASNGQIFGGFVGGLGTKLSSLKTSGSGVAQINGGGVYTLLTQEYDDAVTLGFGSQPLSQANTILTGSNVTFKSMLDGNATDGIRQALEVDTQPGGTVEFGGPVGSQAMLDSLATFTLNLAPDLSNIGTTDIAGGLVRTSSFQYYQDLVTIGNPNKDSNGTADTTLRGSSINFKYALDAKMNSVPQALEIDSIEGAPTTVSETIGMSPVTITPGIIEFDKTVGFSAPLYSLTTVDDGNPASGRVNIDGGLVTTTAGQIYNQAVYLGIDTLLKSTAVGEIDLVSTIDSLDLTSNRNLTVYTSGLTIFGSFVGHQSPLGSLTTGPGTTEINGGLPGANGFTVTTTQAQYYGGSVKLGGETALSAGGNVTFISSLDDLATAGAFGLSITSNNQIFDGEVGGISSLGSLTTNSPTNYFLTPGSGLAEIDGGKVITAGAQTFNDDVTLGFGAVSTQGPVTTTLTGSSITFNRTLSAQGGAVSQALDANTVAIGSVTAGGVVIFQQAVGRNSNIGTDLYSLTTNDFAVNGVPLANEGLTQINGGSVNTTMFQLYDGTVTLNAGTIGTGANTTLTAGTTVKFASALSSDTAANVPQALEIDTLSGGVVTFDGAVSLYSLTTSTVNGAAGQSTTQINGGSVTTSAFKTYSDSFQIYNDAVTLGQPGSPAPSVGLATSLSGAAIEFASTLDSQVGSLSQALTITTTQTDGTMVNGLKAGQIVFDQAVGAMSNTGQTPLFSLTTADSGTPSEPGSVQINGMIIKTTDLQQYGQAVVLGNTAVLSSVASGQISFAKTIDADADTDALTVNTSGVTIFGGVIGSNGKLASLTTDAGGSTQIDGGGFAAGATISTYQFQTFNDVVTVDASTYLHADTGDVTFGNTLDANVAGNTYDMTITSINQVFKAPVGSIAPLHSLTTNTDPDATNLAANQGFVKLQGGIAASGASITTIGDQNYNDGAQLFTDSVLVSNGNGNITFSQAVDSDAAPHALTVNTAGETYFLKAVGGYERLLSLTTDDLNAPAGERGGTTHIDGDLVSTQLNQSYYDAVAIGDLPINGEATLDAAAGNVTFATILNQEPGLRPGTVGLRIQSINQTFGGTVGLQTELLNLETVSNGSGVAAINGGLVQVTDHQSYGDAVTLGQATQLNAFGDVTFAMTVQDGSAGTGQAVASSLSIDSLDQVFQGTVGGQNLPLLSLSTISTGGGFAEIQVNVPTPGNATVTTVGDQTFNDATRLYSDATLNSTTTGGITFVQAVDSAAAPRALTVNTAGTIIFGGAVGGTVPLYSVVTDDPAAVVNVTGGKTQINGDMVSTLALQTYNDPVTVGSAAPSLRAGAGDITFAGTLDAGASANAVDLTITSVNQVFGGLVGSIAPLHSITTNTNPNGITSVADVGSAEILGGLPISGVATITTTGAQTFNDAVTIYYDTTLASTSAGAVTFNSTVDSNAAFRALTVNTAGNTTFGGAVGSKAALLSLTTDDPTAPADELGGVTQINGGSILTTRFQTYNDAVTLGVQPMTTLQAGIEEAATQRDVTFAKTVDDAPGSAGMYGLTIWSLNQVFNGLVGATTPLSTLTTMSDPATSGKASDQGSVQFNAAVPSGGIGTVITQGGQTYNDAATVSAPTVLTSTATGDIKFAATVDSGATTNDLTVNTAGNTTFVGTVGHTSPLLDLVTDDVNAPSTELGGTTAINGGSVNTTSLQIFNDAVTLGQDTTVTGSNVSFLGNLNSTYSLSVTHDATFGGLVGNKNALSFILVNGTTAIVQGTDRSQKSSQIQTVGGQTYAGAMTLSVDAALTSTNGNVLVQSSLGGTFNLTVNASTTTGSAIFSGAVGSSPQTPLSSLTVSADEISLQTVNTTGLQKYTAGDKLNAGLLIGDSIDASAVSYVLNGAVTVDNQRFLATSGTGATSTAYSMQGLYKSSVGGVELYSQKNGDVTLTGDTVIDAGDNITLNVHTISGATHNLSLYAGTVGTVNGISAPTVAPDGSGFKDNDSLTASTGSTLNTPPGTIMVYASTISAKDFNLGWYDPGQDTSLTKAHVSDVDTSPAVSSIVFRGDNEPGTGALTITANDKFTMDPDTKMAVINYTGATSADRGGLKLNLPNDKGDASFATLSDMNVEGDLTVKAEKIRFDNNDPSYVITPLTSAGGTELMRDPTVDFVATGVLKMESNITNKVLNWGSDDAIPTVNFGWNFSTSDSFAENLLGLPGLSANSDANSGKPHLAHEFTAAYFSSTFPGDLAAGGAGTYLTGTNVSQILSQQLYPVIHGQTGTVYALTPDFKADGLTANTPNTAQPAAGVIPSLATSTGLTGAQIEQLNLMHIAAREVFNQEVIDGLDGRRLYVQDADDSSAHIAVDRLDNDVTQNVLDSYDALVSQVIPGNARGKQAWADAVKKSFEKAWDSYTETHTQPEQFDANIFREALMEDPDARQKLVQLNRLFNQLHATMGLTDREFKLCRDGMLKNIVPNNANAQEEDFYRVISAYDGYVIPDVPKTAPSRPKTNSAAPDSKTPVDQKPSDKPKPAPVSVPPAESASIRRTSEVALASR